MTILAVFAIIVCLLGIGALIRPGYAQVLLAVAVILMGLIECFRTFGGHALT
jgi:hypothetical protein